MRLRSLIEAVRQQVRLDPPWWRDLAACYGVSATECLRLGQRQNGRRPDFPGGPSGLTYEEIWTSRPRETEAAIRSFYAELGSWPVFRQCYRHRYGAWPEVLRAMPQTGGVVLEYGCGVAPVAWWLARHMGNNFSVILVDVPGQAITFAIRRLRGRLYAESIEAAFVTDDTVPVLIPPRFGRAANVAIITEVLEHLPHPLPVMTAVLDALRPGGLLVEDYYVHDDSAPSPADLPSARAERPAVYELLGDRCRLIAGQPSEAPHGGGTRRWIKL